MALPSGPWAARAALLACVAFGPSVAAQDQTPPLPGPADAGPTLAPRTGGGRLIEQVRVVGTQRIAPETIVNYLTLQPGDPFSTEEQDRSVKALFDTGLFADVAVTQEGNTLVVTVIENPIINRIAFEGNDALETEDLENEVQLRPRVVFTRSRVQSDTERLLELYRRSGRFSARIDPKVVLLPQNRVDLIFEIDEGPETTVRRIDFIGNTVFDDGDLRDEISTEESAWYKFFTNADRYDPDRVSFDRELLRRFYLSNGYADFQVISAVAELTPDRQDFFLTFTVQEGEQYTFGAIGLTTTFPDLDAETLRGEVTAVEGEIYNAQEIEATISNLTEALSNRRYPFVDVTPEIDRDRENRTISINFVIGEGERSFVERIEISGNTVTTDEVIRREMLLTEGDPFNQNRVESSQRRIDDLGFFSEVKIADVQGSEADQRILNVDVTEQSTGELSLGAGFSSTEGGLLDVRIRQRNLLGEGKDLSLSFTLSNRSQEFDLSYTEPYFLDRDLAAGIDLFRVSRDFQDESSFDQQQTGIGLRLGYPLGENLRQRLFFRGQRTEITDVSVFASRFIRDQEGTTDSILIGQDLIFDTRDSRLNPTEGAVVTLSTSYAGLGGDQDYLRGVLGGTYYIELFDDVVLGNTLEGGYIVGLDQDVRITDRFFIGGDSLRGFEVGGIGPRDVVTNDSLGGNRYIRGSAEVTFPIGLSEELGFKGHAYLDGATLGDVDEEGPDIRDVESLRASAGVGLSWRSPFGPIRFDLAYPILREEFDEEETFRFSFGTRF